MLSLRLRFPPYFACTLLAKGDLLLGKWSGSGVVLVEQRLGQGRETWLTSKPSEEVGHWCLFAALPNPALRTDARKPSAPGCNLMRSRGFYGPLVFMNGLLDQQYV